MVVRRAKSIQLPKGKNPKLFNRVYTSAKFSELTGVGGLAQVQDQRYKILDESKRTNAVLGDIIIEPVREPDTGNNFRNINNQSGNWGLDRIDQFNLPLDGKYHFSRSGSGVDVAIFSSGIFPNHREFLFSQGTSRVGTIYDYRFELNPNHPEALSFSDPNWQDYWGVDFAGHGTHLASIVGGNTCGVGNGIKLWSVKIFNERYETNSQRLIRGLEETLAWHNAKTNSRPTVVLLSYSDFIVERAPEITQAVNDLYAAGVSIISTAGNMNRNVLDNIPGNISPAVLSVGGTDRTDRFMNPINPNDGTWDLRTSDTRQGSNFGENVHVLAPGHNIRGAWVSLDLTSRLRRGLFEPIGEYANISGNSVAAAFVVGVAALILDENPSYIPDDVFAELVNTATKNVVSGIIGKTPNRLLRSTQTQQDFVWDVPEGLIFQINEDSPIEIYVSARMIDSDGTPYPVEYILDSGSLPSGVFLEQGTGRIFGNTPSISLADSGYRKIEELPPEQQRFYGSDQPGFIDYSFRVLIQNQFGSDIRSYSLRVVDTNVPPRWDPQKPQLLNDNFTSNPFIFKNSVFFDFIGENYISDADGNSLQFELLYGDLPSGLVITTSGAISGTIDSLDIDTPGFVSAISISKDYTFAVRASDPFSSVDREFTMRVERTDDNNTPPEWQTFSWDQNSLGTFFQGQPVDIMLIGTDVDNDPLVYREVPVTLPGIPPANGVDIHWGLPDGVDVNPDGRLQGVVAGDDLLGEYYFQVELSDGWNIVTQVMNFTLELIDLGVLNATSTLDWITDSGNLGTLREFDPSTLFVRATTILQNKIVYDLVPAGGSLPPGLQLDRDTGLIYGYVNPVFSTDTYTFTIRASLVNMPSAFLEDQFSITIEDYWSLNISRLDFRLSGLERLGWYELIHKTLPSVLNRESWYRPSDYIFGENWEPEIFLIGGMPLLSESDLIELFGQEPIGTPPGAAVDSNFPNIPTSYWEPIRVIMGDLKAAVARNHAGDIVYEVIYYEILDPNVNVRAIERNSETGETFLSPMEEGVSPVETLSQGVSTSAADTYKNTMPNLYPSSILNWRAKTFEEYGFVDGLEYLPLWMRSEQNSGDTGSILGYVPCIELVRVKPGTAQNFLSILQFINPNIVKRGNVIDIDRLVYTNLSNPNSLKRRVIKFLPGDSASK